LARVSVSKIKIERETGDGMRDSKLQAQKCAISLHEMHAVLAVTDHHSSPTQSHDQREKAFSLQ